MVLTLSNPQPSTRNGLPTEFTLQLGPRSSAQAAAMARILERLGAQVDLAPDGSLVAHRPNA